MVMVKKSGFSLYKVLPEIVLIKPFTMDLYSLISCIAVSTNRSSQKWDCFQDYGNNSFLFLKHIMK